MVLRFLNLGSVLLLLSGIGLRSRIRWVVRSETAKTFLIAYICHGFEDFLLSHLLSAAIPGSSMFGIFDA